MKLISVQPFYWNFPLNLIHARYVWLDFSEFDEINILASAIAVAFVAAVTINKQRISKNFES